MTTVSIFAGLSNKAKSAIFVWSLLAATVLFYFLAPLVSWAWWPFTDLRSFYNFLIYLTTIHVTLTAFVYLDRSAYGVISRHKLRFYAVAPGIFVSFSWSYLFFQKT